jgi:hypothetical protein
MSAPSLDALRDIHLPPTPGLATLLAEWWLIAAAAALLAAAGWGVRRFMQQRQLRMALRQLHRLAAAHARDGDAGRLACGLSQLMRRYAMDRFPQAGIGGLTGTAWLQFLDTYGGDSAFSDGVGAVLATRPYQAQGAFDAAALIALVRRWLKSNPP